jgi:kynurenine 3-monooxygenase
MPWEKFNQITTENDLLDFFSSTFPDSIPLFGDTLVKDYFSNTKGPLISIKCKPYHYKNAVIVGDAAHAMVPFYGQGMNCGFEDLLVLEEMFDRCLSERPSKDEILKILDDYTEQRAPDAHAMCDLAMHNYIEMRSSVIKTSYIIRNKIERFLHRFFPKSIIPLYTMVSFTRIRYSKALEQYKKQTNWFEWGSFTFKVAIFSTIGVFAYKRLANYYSLFNYAPNFIP